MLAATSTRSECGLGYDRRHSYSTGVGHVDVGHVDVGPVDGVQGA